MERIQSVPNERFNLGSGLSSRPKRLASDNNDITILNDQQYPSNKPKTSQRQVRVLLAPEKQESKQLEGATSAAILKSSDNISTQMGSLKPMTAGYDGMISQRNLKKSNLFLTSPNSTNFLGIKSCSQFKSDFSSPRLRSAAENNPEHIWNQTTFSFTNSRLGARLQLAKRGVIASTTKYDYLSRMHKAKVSKLQREVDEEKNKVKSRRDILEGLKNELEQLRILSGYIPQQEQKVVEKEDDEEDADEDEKEEKVEVLQKIPIKLSDKIQKNLSQQSLRPTMANLGSKLSLLNSSLSINNSLTHLGSQLIFPITPLQATLSPNQFKPPPLITSAPQLSVSLFQPYYTMMLDDDTITANLEKMMADLQVELKKVEFKHKQEFFTYQRLVHQEIKEKAQITYLTLKQRELQPDKAKYERAVKAIPRIKMLGDTSKEMQKNLIGERRKELEKRKEFYKSILQKRVNQLKVESKDLDELKAAMAKRDKRVDEVKEYLQEIKETNREEEATKQDFVQSLLNRNMEFKVFAGIEVILKLEQVLQTLEVQREAKGLEVDEQQGMDMIVGVRRAAVKIGELTQEDIDGMNRKKVQMLHSYEQHFSKFFLDLKSVKINDDYLNKRYTEICLQIQSQTQKYQDLVQKTNLQRKLIKQYSKFKETLIRDMEFLSKFKNPMGNTPQFEISFFQDKKKMTVNELRCSETELRSSLIKEENQAKSKLVANCLSIMMKCLQKNCFVLKEIYQLVRFEEPKLNKEEKERSIPVPLVDYLSPFFAQLLSKYANKFGSEYPNFISNGMDQHPARNGSSLRLLDSPARPKDSSTKNIQARQNRLLGASSTNLAAKRRTISTFNMHELSGLHKGVVRNHYSPQKRSKDDTSARGGSSAAVKRVLNNDSGSEMHTQEGYLESITNDFKSFFRLFVVKKEHEGIFHVAQVKGLNHKQCIKYIQYHKLLSKIYEMYQQAKEIDNPSQIELVIQYNGKEFQQQYPKLGNQPRRKNDLTITGPIDLDETESFVPEEDYVDPSSKKIISHILLEERLIKEKEDRKRKKEIEKQRKYALMSDDQKRAQGRLKLQKQVFGLRDFERNELGFRAQFKETLNQVFSNQVPPSKQTKEYLILDGDAIVTSTTRILTDREKRKTASYLQNGEVQITTSPIVQRIEHVKTHRNLKLKSQALSFNSRLGSHTQRGMTHSEVRAPIIGAKNDYNSLGNLNAQDSLPKLPKTLTQRVLERQMQRRNMVKLDKPEDKPPNVVLHMLQQKFPELEQLFMDTAQRREIRRNLLKQRRNSLQSDNSNRGDFGIQMNNTASKTQGGGVGSANSFYRDTTNAGGPLYSSDTDPGTQGEINGFDNLIGTQETIVVVEQSPLLKVKPLMQRGGRGSLVM